MRFPLAVGMVVVFALIALQFLPSSLLTASGEEAVDFAKVLAGARKGGVVELDPGKTYVFSRSLFLLRDIGGELVVEGNGARVVVNTAWVYGTPSTASLGFDKARRLVFRDIVFLLNTSSRSGFSITISHCGEVVFENVTIKPYPGREGDKLGILGILVVDAANVSVNGFVVEGRADKTISFYAKDSLVAKGFYAPGATVTLQAPGRGMLLDSLTTGTVTATAKGFEARGVNARYLSVSTATTARVLDSSIQSLSIGSLSKQSLEGAKVYMYNVTTTGSTSISRVSSVYIKSSNLTRLSIYTLKAVASTRIAVLDSILKGLSGKGVSVAEENALVVSINSEGGAWITGNTIRGAVSVSGGRYIVITNNTISAETRSTPIVLMGNAYLVLDGNRIAVAPAGKNKPTKAIHIAPGNNSVYLLTRNTLDAGGLAALSIMDKSMRTTGSTVIVAGNTLENFKSLLAITRSTASIIIAGNLLDPGRKTNAPLISGNSPAANVTLVYNRVLLYGDPLAPSLYTSKKGSLTLYFNDIVLKQGEPSQYSQCPRNLAYNVSLSSPTVYRVEYNGSVYETRIGNHYSWISLEDADGNGIGDEPVELLCTNDTHPLVGNITSYRIAEGLVITPPIPGTIMNTKSYYAITVFLNGVSSVNGTAIDPSPAPPMVAVLAENLTLREGENTITLPYTTVTGLTKTIKYSVYVDTEPPTVSLEAPREARAAPDKLVIGFRAEASDNTCILKALLHLFLYREGDIIPFAATTIPLDVEGNATRFSRETTIDFNEAMKNRANIDEALRKAEKVVVEAVLEVVDCAGNLAGARTYTTIYLEKGGGQATTTTATTTTTTPPSQTTTTTTSAAQTTTSEAPGQPATTRTTTSTRPSPPTATQTIATTTSTQAQQPTGTGTSTALPPQSTAQPSPSEAAPAIPGGEAAAIAVIAVIVILAIIVIARKK